MQIVRVIRCHFVALLVFAGLMMNVADVCEFANLDVATHVADVNCPEGPACPHHEPHSRCRNSCTCVKTVQTAPRQNAARTRLRNAEVAAVQVSAPVQTAVKLVVVVHSPIPSLPHVLVRTVILQT